MEIHIARNGQQSGPFSLEEVRRQLAAGTLSPTHLAWTQGAANWVPLASFPGLTPPPPSSPLPISPLRNLRWSGPEMGGVKRRPQETSGAAVASLICGILSIFLPIILSLPAIICGHVARANIRASGGKLTGAGMALAGLLIGYLWLAFIPVVAILAGIALPVFSQVQLRGAETQSLSNAKSIATACKLYAMDHKGAFPPKLDDLVPEYLPDRKTFVSTLSPKEAVAYYYYGGTEKDPPEKVLLMSKFRDRRGKRIIVYADMSGVIGFSSPDVLPPSGQ